MNLLFRMLWVFISSFFKPKIDNIFEENSLFMRVLPTDCDTNFHLNNGRYFTLMDLGRFDLILRTGLLKLMLASKSVPVLGSSLIRFRLPLDPFEPFTLTTRILGFDEKFVYIEQKFIKTRGQKAGAVAAIALLKGNFYNQKTKKSVPTSELLEAINFKGTLPELPAYALQMMAAEEALRDVTAQAGSSNTR